MRILSVAALLVVAVPGWSDGDPTRIFPDKSELKDARLGPPKDLNGYFPFTPPASKQAWDDRAAKVRTQILVATGLWPMPEKTPLNPVIHGKIERDGYTVEKVSFASMPGHYVTGNLYTPAVRYSNPSPGVLFAHGHWANGRFHDAGEKAAAASVQAKG